VSTQFLSTISEILIATELSKGSHVTDSSTSLQAEQKWAAAIASLSRLVQQVPSAPLDPGFIQTASCTSNLKGIALTGPEPVFSDPNLGAELPTWSFTACSMKGAVFQQPAPNHNWLTKDQAFTGAIPLLPDDPVGEERFCLVLTNHFSLVLVLAKPASGRQQFLFSFTPEAVQTVWETLRTRAALTQPASVSLLDNLVQHFAFTAPHYETVVQFSRWMLQLIAVPPGAANAVETALSNKEVSIAQVHCFGERGTQPILPPRLSLNQALEQSNQNTCQFSSNDSQEAFSGFDTNQDVELLQAIAHEVRTPLATISTLTRLLLKRPDLPLEVTKRLEAIYRECSEQIDRFSLIFRAAEIETSPPQRLSVQLTSVSLAQVLQQSIPRWQKWAARRNLKLHVSLPQQMPAIVSDPTMLDQALTGLVDRFTRSLPAGSHIHIQVDLAGDQLKLQLQTECSSVSGQPATDPTMPILKSVGQLLMLQPETGNLSLSLPVTKNLFQALGGKFTVRRQARQGEVLTIFLPLGRDGNTYQ